MKLYAQWRQAHIVNLDTNGGDIPYNPETVDDGGNAIEPEVAPSRTGYTFRYWSTKQDGSSGPYNFDTPVISDLTLYAVWQEKTYTVTFDTGGGSAIETQTVPWGIRPSVHPPTRSGADTRSPAGPRTRTGPRSTTSTPPSNRTSPYMRYGCPKAETWCIP